MNWNVYGSVCRVENCRCNTLKLGRLTESVITDYIPKCITVNGYCYNTLCPKITHSLTIRASLLLWGKLTEQFAVWHKQPLSINPIRDAHCCLHRRYTPGPQTEQGRGGTQSVEPTWLGTQINRAKCQSTQYCFVTQVINSHIICTLLQH